MKKTKFRGLQEFAEPITGTGLLILAGIGGAIAWVALRGGPKKIWFAESKIMPAGSKSEPAGDYTLSGIGATEAEATAQAAAVLAMAKRMAAETKQAPPTIQTRVYKDENASATAWVLSANIGDGPVLMVFFANKTLLSGFIEEWKREASSEKMGPLASAKLTYEKVKIPSKYTAGVMGFSGIGLAGFSMMKLPSGAVPSAFYKFTNPEEIIQ
jgi:hypothetical protein